MVLSFIVPGGPLPHIQEWLIKLQSFVSACGSDALMLSPLKRAHWFDFEVAFRF